MYKLAVEQEESSAWFVFSSHERERSSRMCLAAPVVPLVCWEWIRS